MVSGQPSEMLWAMRKMSLKIRALQLTDVGLFSQFVRYKLHKCLQYEETRVAFDSSSVFDRVLAQIID